MNIYQTFFQALDQPLPSKELKKQYKTYIYSIIASILVLLVTEWYLNSKESMLLKSSRLIVMLILIYNVFQIGNMYNKVNHKLKNELGTEKLQKVIMDMKIQKAIAKMKLDRTLHTPDDCESLDVFKKTIQLKSECIFAKQAIIWGAPTWKEHLTIEENVDRMLPTFVECLAKTDREKIDGYVLEIKGKDLISSELLFTETVRRVLTYISKMDPAEEHCMENDLTKLGWHFRFNNMAIFTTTFAPYYPLSNSRCTYGDEESAWMLFQPEASFLRHNLILDHASTSWNNPKTKRDQIRIAFRNAGREYHIPPTEAYLVSHHIVKPIDGKSSGYVNWWNG